MSPTRLPDFVVIGAPKSGTTSLHRYLGQHPSVYVTPVKEPMHFVSPDRPMEVKGPGARIVRRNVMWRRADYERTFEGRRPEHLVAGEASASYLWASEAPAAMARVIPDVKLIAVLRQPADRAYSHYLHNRRGGREPLRSFEAALDAEEERASKRWSYNLRYVDRGRYGTQLDRYLRYFEREQLLLLPYEDLIADAPGVMRQICAHLGIPAYEFDLSEHHNTAREPARSRKTVRALGIESRLGSALSERTPPAVRGPVHRLFYRRLTTADRTIDGDLRRRITAELRGEIERTAEILDRDLSHWFDDAPVG